MIQLTNVTLSHHGMPVVQEATIAIAPGQVVSLTGRTGSGKTSLIRALYGDLSPSEGEIEIDGIRISGKGRRKVPRLRREMGIIFQDDKLLEDRSVYDNMRFALSIRVKSAKEINRLALKALTDIGLSHLRSKRPDQLSGGEAQRVGVARALASNPTIVLADEPTGDLDPDTTREIFRFLASRRTPDSMYVIATHEEERALESFPDARRIRLEGTRLVEDQASNTST
jgi:cell division transport system ATP-binding protein